MRQPSIRMKPRISVPFSASSTTSCPRNLDCSCLNTRSHLVPRIQTPPSSYGCVEHCPDLIGADVEQMKALQNSIDHFTDYEHYERCCDGHLNGTRKKDECCTGMEEDLCSPVEKCPEYYEDCDECAKEHEDCYDEVEVCSDDCDECEEECEERGHEPEDCPHDHPTTRDNCTVSYTYDTPLPQLGPTCDFDSQAILNIMQEVKPCTTDCSAPVPAMMDFMKDPLDGMPFDSDMDHWQTFVQTHHCAPDPCMLGQSPQFQHPQHMDPAFGFTFGCDPSIPENQYPWQRQGPVCKVPLHPQFSNLDPTNFHQLQLATPAMSKNSTSPQPLTPTETSTPSSRTCEWVMPCGSICGATFTRTEDLKKHIKNSHSTKGTVTCRWKSCSASFATEAALTGHISKKHLTVSDEEGPWKCTFSGCTKSFMYKQVRDDHVASHNGGNRMHCPICHQWLNCEGSNFRRHMASHGPKNEYMRCRFENLGCKKRFPRLDNLRRHEACCKFGKRAAGVHHHHRRVHVGHAA